MSEQFCRFLHDVQRVEYNFKPRSKSPTWKGEKNPPEEVAFDETPTNNGKGNIPLLDPFENFTAALNDPKAYKALMIPAAGWTNSNTAPDTVTFGGNLGIVEEVRNQRALIKAFAYDGPAPSHKFYNYQLTPWLVHKFGSVTKTGGLGKLGKGLDAYFPLMKRTQIWCRLIRLEMFPPLGYYTVTAQGILPRNADLHIRFQPSKDSAEIGGLKRGEKVEIVGYYPRAGDVWARLMGDGYICLSQQRGWKQDFFTTWSMKTSPPLPPA